MPLASLSSLPWPPARYTCSLVREGKEGTRLANLPDMSQHIELKTSDGVLIAADYYAPPAASPKGLLLLHMMPATRQGWRGFAAKAQEAGFHVLAIDFRGHGESQGGPAGYKSFSDAEHQASRLDVEASADFLESKGVSAIYLGGASIGANLALQYLAEHTEAKAAFLLSPGLDYRGIRTAEYAGVLRSGQAVYCIASRDDQYSANTVQQLFEVAPAGVEKAIKFFGTAGHGTEIFVRESHFADEVVAWLRDIR